MLVRTQRERNWELTRYYNNDSVVLKSHGAGEQLNYKITGYISITLDAYVYRHGRRWVFVPDSEQQLLEIENLVFNSEDAEPYYY